MILAEPASVAPTSRGNRSGKATLWPLRSRRLVVLVALATLVITLVMLAVFQQVVRQAVLQGELRAQSNALLSHATWRCNALKGRGLRDACLAQLVPVPRDNARLWSLHVAAAAASAAPQHR
jgi:hypothetical protein